MDPTAPPAPTPLRQTPELVQRRLQKRMADRRAALDALHAELPRVRAAGIEALHRLMPVAQQDSGQSQRIARFLLGLYNGSRFPFDLTDLRGLDYELFQDCMAVLAMDYMPEMEVHRYFDDGGALFEQLASRFESRE